MPGGPEGQLVTKYTCGLALLWTPFFFLGHWAAGWLDYPQDGFSPPYQIAIAFGGLLFALLGLGLLRRVLLRYFSDVVTTLVLVLLVLGSNYFQYAVFDAAMAHNYLFTGYALLLWLTIRWHERPTRRGAFSIGLTLGLLVLIRPSEAVAAVVPVLWGVGSVAAARAKLALLRSRWPDVLLLVLGGLLGVLPQLLYWHWATGHFMFYSYGDQHFSFLKPHLWQVLFSFRKGWLHLFAAAAAAAGGPGGAVAPPPGAGGAGAGFFRAEPVGGVGLGHLVVRRQHWAAGPGAELRGAGPALGRRRWRGCCSPRAGPALQVVAVVAAVLLVDLNLFQHWQYMRSIINPEEMNRRYYFAVFNKTMPSQADYALLDVKTRLPLAERHYRPQPLGKLDFENQPPDAATGISADMGYYSRQSFHADAAHAYGPALTCALGDAGLAAGRSTCGPRAGCSPTMGPGATSW